MRFLPAPRMDLTRGTRMKVVDLLSRLSKDAKLAVPAMGRAVKDEDPSVRQIAITFFTEGEDRNALLNQMETSAKRRLLPEFIGTMQDADPGVRNNATIALRYYPEQAQIVVPVLVKALNDPVPRVRELVAEALNQVAPEVVVTAGVVRVAIGILNDPDDQIAYRAARLLGQMRKEPALTVPALIESMHGSNGLVAAEAASALGNFPDQANVIVPVLLKVYQDTNSVVPRWATAGALKRIDSTAAGKAGAK
jgi:HEAT repeat protein